MNSEPLLNSTVIICLIVAAVCVIAYWIWYTRRLKTPPHSGTQAGIAMAKQREEHHHNHRDAA